MSTFNVPQLDPISIRNQLGSCGGKLVFCIAVLAWTPMTLADESPDTKLLKTFVDELVSITPGQGKFPKTFRMGSENGPASEQPAHAVTLTKPFAMSRYEVPQNLYQLVMDENPSRWKGPRNSAEMMTWQDANTFCERLTKRLRQEKLIGESDLIRLPTEAEWEYCCRAGTTTAYSFGESATRPGDAGKSASILDTYAWHTGNAAGNDPPVGALKPNPWGLYDMHGYLSEFVADNWHANYQEAPSDGSAWLEQSQPNPKTTQTVIRGGSWKDVYSGLRSAARKRFGQSDRDDAVGFRCVRSTRSANAN